MADIQKLAAQVESQRKKCDQEKAKLEKLESRLAVEKSKEFSQLAEKYNITDMTELEKVLADWQQQKEKENEDE